jgi:hypothetical protein
VSGGQARDHDATFAPRSKNDSAADHRDREILQRDLFARGRCGSAEYRDLV